MASRGIWRYMGARTRRSLALSWAALFVLSLFMQYFSFAVAQPVLAAHNEGIFELDGNATDQAAAGADWQNGAEGSLDQFFVGASAETDANDVTYFHTGGSKDEHDIPSWAITDTSVPDKDELLDAFAAVYEQGGDTWVYFGADRFDNDGTAQIGFWFFQGNVGIANGDFTGAHVDGDVLILSEYTNGGVVSLICAYEWDGSGGGSNIGGAGGCDPATNGSNLNLVAAGTQCDVADGSFEICAITNAADGVATHWPFTNKDGDSTYDKGQFFEGGINLSDMFGGNPPCFGSFLAETRSSAETDAQLKDFAFGSLDTCVPPDITTQSSVSTADFGASVTDTATLSGSNGPVDGTVAFFICTPAQTTAAGCPEGAGAQVGSAVTIVAGSATSSAYTVGLTAAAVGTYCWRAEYTPSADSEYLAATHTNATTECFTVAPATIDIEKVANPAGPVSAGDVIGFDITVTNNGTQTTLGISVSDNLPAGVDWSMSAPTGSTTGLSCSITGSVGSEVLGCTKPSLAAGQSFSVHVSGTTDAADCGTVSNTATVNTSNDGSDSDTATVDVLCPDVQVTKTPDGGTVNAGENIVWSIKVENLGPGVATGVALTDDLPAGIDWSESEADCSISGPVDTEVLSCTVGDLASGASKTYTVTGPTDAQDCGVVNNTGQATATNEPSNVLTNNSDTGSVTVQCAEIDILKTANPAGPVSAGDQIGFDITVTNNGDGVATDVVVTDTLPTLPGGLSWSVGTPTGDTTGVSCAIDSGVLTCTDDAMAAGDSFTVHISSDTTADSCGTVSNTASVETGNDGSDESTATVDVLCPDLEVVKTADNGGVSAWEPVGFTITLTNLGPGTAYDVHLEDPLPGDIDWSIDPAVAGCAIVASVLTCDFASLASGASVEIHVEGVTDETDCGLLENTVTVGASNEPDDVLDNNTDSATIEVLCPDVTVTKTADNSPVTAGQVASFTITVTNIGPGTAYNVHVEDVLPAGVDWEISPAVDGCAIAAGVLTCDFPQPGDDTVIEIHVSGLTDAADCGELPNLVTVSAGNEPEDATGNNSDEATIVVDCPDVAVEKTADNSPISAGEEAAFTITVTNLGPGTAFDVTLEDTLPGDIAWSEDSDFCAIAAGVLTCDFGDMASGASHDVHVTGETDAQDCGELPNTATVAASNEPDDALQNNESSATIVVDCPLIVITKTADDAVVNAGDQIGFTITVTNTGDGSAFNVTVSDTLPVIAGLSWTIESQTGGWTIDGGVLEFGPATLASGASTSVHIVSPTTADTCGEVPNLASVTFTGGSGQDSSTVTVECPDIEVTKTASNSPIAAGEEAIFAITVENIGEGTADDVVLTDELPAGLDWSDDSDACEIAAGTLTCDLGDMEPGDTFTVHVSAATSGDDCGVIPNLAEATASNEAEEDTGNNSDDAEIVVECPDVAVVKTATNTPIPVGDDLVFEITVTNLGEGTAFDVVLTDALPAGFDWAEDSDACEIAGGTLTCDLGDMEPGDEFSVTLTAPTDGAGEDANIDCGESLVHQIPNVAVVSASNEPDDVLENNEDDATITVLCSALVIEKSFTGNTGGTDPDLNVPAAEIGDILTYTLEYTGAGPLNNAVITDVIPAGLEYVDGSATGNADFDFVSYDAATRTLTWEASATLPDPANGTVTYQVLVTEEAPELAQPLINVATIDSDETEPDSDTASVAVLAPPLELTPPPTNTLAPRSAPSNPGFALMLVLLGVAGLALGIGFVTPVPEHVRRRDRLG